MSALDELRDVLLRHSTAAPEPVETAVPGLFVFRADAPSAPTPRVYAPMHGIVASGRKSAALGDRLLEYAAGDGFVVSVDLPIVGTVAYASPEEPYLALAVRPDPAELQSLAAEAPAPTTPESPTGSGESAFQVAPLGSAALEAALRLARLLDHPEDVPVLAPLRRRELLYRLLTGPTGAGLQLAAQGGSMAGIGRAVGWLRARFREDFDAERLARIASVSVPTLNRRFRALTGRSPLAYQKEVRLLEARRLLLLGELGVTAVADAVGYTSASQFHREYRRLFGAAPRADAQQLLNDTSGD